MQGREPERMVLVLGDGREERFRVADFACYTERARRRLEEALDRNPGGTYPERVEHCGVCRWRDRCRTRWEKDDHLVLVAGMRSDQARKLNQAGVRTVAELAGLAAGREIAGISTPALDRLRTQAELQVRQRTDGGAVVHRLLPAAAADIGMGALPPPAPGDLFFDMEGDPYSGPDGQQYLFGFAELADEGPRYTSFWAHDSTQEKLAFERSIDFIIERLDRRPDLQAGVLVDLYRVLRQAVMVSQDSYSLKKLEPLYRSEVRAAGIKDAGSSIAAYERWLAVGRPEILDEIEAYNRDDCNTLIGLRSWLEERRNEFRLTYGSEPPRPQPQDGETREAQRKAEQESARLAAGLLGGVAEDPGPGDPPGSGAARSSKVFSTTSSSTRRARSPSRT